MDLSDVCRLCGKNDDMLIDIFGSTGRKHNISEKINQRLQIFITEADVLSKHLCFTCCGKLDSFDKFVKNVHSVQTIFSESLSRNSLNISRHFSTTSFKADPELFEIIEIPDEEVGIEKEIDAGKRQLDTSHSIDPSACKKLKGNCLNNENDSLPLNEEKTPEQTDIIMNKNWRRDGIKEPTISESLQDEYAIKIKRVMRKESKSIHRKVNSSKKISNEKCAKDFFTQNGNTLYADLKYLKHSLLLNQISPKNAQVLTDLIDKETSDKFCDTKRDKGCQAEIILYASNAGDDPVYVKQRTYEKRKNAMFINVSPNNTINIAPLLV